jgi:hypothetical protein
MSLPQAQPATLRNSLMKDDGTVLYEQQIPA